MPPPPTSPNTPQSSRARTIAYRRAHPANAAELFVENVRQAELVGSTAADVVLRTGIASEETVIKRSLETLFATLNGPPGSHQRAIYQFAVGYVPILEEFYKQTAAIWYHSNTQDPIVIRTNLIPSIRSLFTDITALEQFAQDERRLLQGTEIIQAIENFKTNIRRILQKSFRILETTAKRQNLPTPMSRAAKALRSQMRPAVVGLAAAITTQSTLIGGALTFGLWSYTKLREHQATQNDTYLREQEARLDPLRREEQRSYARSRTASPVPNPTPSPGPSPSASPASPSPVPSPTANPVNSRGPGGSPSIPGSSGSPFSFYRNQLDREGITPPQGVSGGANPLSALLPVLQQHTALLTGILHNTAPIEQIKINTQGPTEASREFLEPKLGPGSLLALPPGKEGSGWLSKVIGFVGTRALIKLGLGGLTGLTGASSLVAIRAAMNKFLGKGIKAGVTAAPTLTAAATAAKSRAAAMGPYAKAIPAAEAVGEAAASSAVRGTGMGIARGIVTSATKALPIVQALFSFWDYKARRAAGQSPLQAGLGVGATILGGTLGGAAGTALGAPTVAGVPVAAIAGATGVGLAFRGAMDWATGANNVVPPSSAETPPTRVEKRALAQGAETIKLIERQIDAGTIQQDNLGRLLRVTTTISNDVRDNYDETRQKLPAIDNPTPSPAPPAPPAEDGQRKVPKPKTSGQTDTGKVEEYVPVTTTNEGIKDFVKYTYDFYANHKELGLQPIHAAGFTGNAQYESGAADLDPKKMKQGDNLDARGMFQWTKKRRDEYFKLTGKKLEEQSVPEQLNWSAHELLHEENAALLAIKATTTTDAASLAVEKSYERPLEATANSPIRKKYTADTFKKYSDGISIKPPTGATDAAASPVAAGTTPKPSVLPSQDIKSREDIQEFLKSRLKELDPKNQKNTTIVNNSPTNVYGGNAGSGRPGYLETPSDGDPLIQRLAYGY